VFALYWLTRRRGVQNALLIASSYLFYGWWDYRFCALMAVSSLVDYFIGLAMGSAESQRKRRMLLAISVTANLGLLGVFKYFNFFEDNLAALASQFGWTLNWGTLEIILPVGISFYTFQTMSYTIDIYRKKLKPTRSIIDYLAFVSFFPQLVAGPIERAKNLLPQFAKSRTFDVDQASDGCRQILWGFLKKLLIADRLAVFVDSVYGEPSMASGPMLVLATIGFAVQIYCDFSAYSDIAIGTAKLFNIRLMRNFAYPFFAQSTTELWQRWHISLSTWLRDYVCLPIDRLGRSRAWRVTSIFVTFLVCGLWHGAAWHFVAWGGMNGALVAGETRKKRIRTTVPGGEDLLPNPRVFIRIVATFGIFCATVLFFRASSMHDALLIWKRIIADVVSPAAYSGMVEHLLADKVTSVTFLLVVAFFAIEWVQRRHAHPFVFEKAPLSMRWAIYSTCIWASLFFMPTETTNPFIYFVF
jgi:alginate O-acetyltransferase complex protein AlgI